MGRAASSASAVSGAVGACVCGGGGGGRCGSWHCRPSPHWAAGRRVPPRLPTPLTPPPTSLARPAGTNVGGGTFWGLGKLLTGLDDFDDILAMSAGGDNSRVSPGWVGGGRVGGVRGVGGRGGGGAASRQVCLQRPSLPTLTATLCPQVDMLVGDIYGGRDYTGIGLSGARGGGRGAGGGGGCALCVARPPPRNTAMQTHSLTCA